MSRNIATMSLSSIISEIDGDFRRKLQNFPIPFNVAGFPLELGTGTGDHKTRVMGLPGRTISLTISSAIWIQSTNVMDRRTDTG